MRRPKGAQLCILGNSFINNCFKVEFYFLPFDMKVYFKKNDAQAPYFVL